MTALDQRWTLYAYASGPKNLYDGRYLIERLSCIGGWGITDLVDSRRLCIRVETLAEARALVEQMAAEDSQVGQA